MLIFASQLCAQNSTYILIYTRNYLKQLEVLRVDKKCINACIGSDVELDARCALSTNPKGKALAATKVSSKERCPIDSYVPSHICDRHRSILQTRSKTTRSVSSVLRIFSLAGWAAVLALAKT